MENKNGLTRTCRSIEHGLVKIEDFVLAAFMIVLCFSIIYQVICRYVLQISSPWCEELARYLFIAMTYIGSGRAFINNGHINVDLMDTIIGSKAKNPEKTMRTFEKFSMILTLIFVVAFAVIYIQYLQTVAKRPQTSASMHINMLIPMSTILIGALLMVIHSACRFFYPYEAPASEE